jgi:hypothetical protein
VWPWLEFKPIETAQVSRVSALTRNGSYSILTLAILDPGKYVIEACTHSEELDVLEESSLTIEVQDLFFTRTFLMAYVGGRIGLLGLRFVILKAPKDKTQQQQSLREIRVRLIGVL